MTSNNGGEIGRHPAFIGFIITLCITAVLLNLILLFAVIKVSRLRTSIDIFITNLAAGDILHAGIVTPVLLKNAAVHNEDFYGNNFVCKLVMFIPLFSVMAAILTIVAIAIDRYRVIIQQKHLNRRGALVAIVFTWLLSILISAPQLYEYDVYEDVNELDSNVTYTSCGSDGIIENFEIVYATLVFIFAFLVPLFILFVCYIKLVINVWSHGKQFRTTKVHCIEGTSSKTAHDRSKRTDRIDKTRASRTVKILKMLVCITGTFVGLWTPYFILFGMTEILDIDDTSNFTEWPHVVCRTMTVLSTLINPVLYLASSEALRDALCNIIGKRRPDQFTYGSGGSQALSRLNKRESMNIHGVNDEVCLSTSPEHIYSVPLKLYTGTMEIPRQINTPNCSTFSY